MRTYGINAAVGLRILALSAVILAQRFLPIEIASPLLVSMGMVVALFSRHKRSYFSVVWPLFVVLVCGIIGLYGHESRDVLRDLSYALTPVALIYMGYWIADHPNSWLLMLDAIFFYSCALALIHLSYFLVNPDLLNADFTEVRKVAGGTGDLVTLALCLSFFTKGSSKSYKFPKLLPRAVIIPILLTSFVLSYSRTSVVVAVILTMTLKGSISRVTARGTIGVLILIMSFVAVVLTTPDDEVDTFRGHLARSFVEIAVSDYQEQKAINDNWRGFESYRAVVTYYSGSNQQLVIGQGFGALVDLEIFVALGGERDLRFIPITHNGYVYVLLKAGIIGLFCYLIFYAKAIGIARGISVNSSHELIFYSRLLLGCILSLIATMYVVGGMAEMHNSELVLLSGYLMCRLIELNKVERGLGSSRVFE